MQAAAGFLEQLDELPDLTRRAVRLPAALPRSSRRLLQSRIRVFATTSMGRLFDAAAALLGFTRPVTFEGQAAMWLEQLARGAATEAAVPVPVRRRGARLSSAARAVIARPRRGRDPSEIARAFHAGLAQGLRDAAVTLCRAHRLDTVVVSGGVFQNALLLRDLAGLLEASRLALWTNHLVPPNDGGISLGQAALGALGPCTSSRSR